jgi:hypothetical protein
MQILFKVAQFWMPFNTLTTNLFGMMSTYDISTRTNANGFLRVARFQ